MKNNEDNKNGKIKVSDDGLYQYNRDEILDICEKAIVDVSEWNNRDTPQSQESLGVLSTLLKANCSFNTLYEKFPSGLCTNSRMVWLEVFRPDFGSFENGFDLENNNTLSKITFYLPTLDFIKKCNGKDWY